ncbi:MAG: hypothetical protein MJ239_05805 [Bacilli bacterium]|nr:hypothetical protein [Bacilli bacterium]
MKPKKSVKVPKNANKGVYAIVLFLLGFFLLLAPWTKYMYGPSYLFILLTGVVGTYCIPVILFVYAGNLLAKKPMKKATGWRLFFGYVLLLVGVEILFSSIVIKQGVVTDPGSFKSFLDGLFDGAQPKAAGSLAYSYELAGGLLGYGVASLFKDGLSFLAYVISIVAVLGGLTIVFFPLIKFAFGIILSKSEKEEVEPEDEYATYDEKEEFDYPEEEPAQIENTSLELGAVETEPIGEDLEFQQMETPFEPETAPEYQETPVNNDYPHEIPVTRPNETPMFMNGLSEAFFDIDGTGFASEKAPAPTEVKPQQSYDRSYETPKEAQIQVGSTPVEQTPNYAEPPSFLREQPLQEEKPQEMPDINNEFAPSSSQEAVFEQPLFQETPAQEEYRPEPSAAPEASFVAPEPQAESMPVEESTPAPQVTPAPRPQPQPMPAPVQEEPTHIAEPTILAGWHWAEERPAYELPSMDLLKTYDNSATAEANNADCEAKKELLNQTLLNFKAGAQVTSFTIGPSVTRYDVKTDTGISVATLSKYMDDISQALSGAKVHFEKVVAGKTTAGLEIANSKSTIVGFREILEKMPPLDENNSMLIPFGETISGEYKSADLTTFPHLLVAGTTGSGKSIFIHGLILSLLMRNRPEDCKFVMVDPKRVEMTKYKNLPHLLCPIIQEPEETKVCLEKLCDEMELRYKVFAAAECRDIREFNNEYADSHKVARMPFIVVVVDEYADIVEQCKDVAGAVSRLVAKARAAGIHLVIATQRPSTNVINGVIKANIASRVALKVSTTVDSQVILDRPGAEDLIGYGDMLVMCDRIQVGATLRMQGCMVTGGEIRAVTEYIRAHAETRFNPAFLDLSEKVASVPADNGTNGGPSAEDVRNAANNEKYEMIKDAIMHREYTSISQIQREFGVGFPRAGKIFAQLQKEGIVDLNPISASKGCRVLVHADDTVSADNPGSTDQNTVISSPFGNQ